MSGQASRYLPFVSSDHCTQVAFPAVRRDRLSEGGTEPASQPSCMRRPSCPMAGRTKSSNPTNAETGFPGRPMKGMPRYSPTASGLPGRTLTRQKMQLAVCPDDISHEVQGADAHAGRRDDQVGLFLIGRLKQGLNGEPASRGQSRAG